jgi:catechol 2,3-dioxygenase
MDPDTDGLPAGTSIGRAALRVADLEDVAAFYREVVGLDRLERTDSRAVLGAGDTPMLVLERDPDAPPRKSTGAGLYHNAFRVPSRAALGDALGRIRDRWHLDGASDHGVSEALYLTDPADNGVEIYRDRPRDEWPRGDDGSVQMGTDPLDMDGVRAAAAGDSGVPAATDLGHVHLEVTSLDGFRECYVETLGFEIQMEVPAAAFVSAGGYHHHVGANTWHQRSGPAEGQGLDWFEIVLPSASALDAVRERVAASRFGLTEREEGIAVTDADGIDVRLRAED